MASGVPKAVQVVSSPFYEAADGRDRSVLRVAVGDVGLLIGVPDRQGNLPVLFDTRFEYVHPSALGPYSDITRAQMYSDCVFLAVGDQDEAFTAYWRHVARLKDRAARAVKVCGRCKEAKALREFSLDASRRDGFRSTCKPCEAEYQAGLRAMAAREQ